MFYVLSYSECKPPIYLIRGVFIAPGNLTHLRTDVSMVAEKSSSIYLFPSWNLLVGLCKVFSGIREHLACIYTVATNGIQY